METGKPHTGSLGWMSLVLLLQCNSWCILLCRKAYWSPYNCIRVYQYSECCCQTYYTTVLLCLMCTVPQLVQRSFIFACCVAPLFALLWCPVSVAVSLHAYVCNHVFWNLAEGLAAVIGAPIVKGINPTVLQCRKVRDATVIRSGCFTFAYVMACLFSGVLYLPISTPVSVFAVELAEWALSTIYQKVYRAACS